MAVCSRFIDHCKLESDTSVIHEQFMFFYPYLPRVSPLICRMFLSKKLETSPVDVFRISSAKQSTSLFNLRLWLNFLMLNLIFFIMIVVM